MEIPVAITVESARATALVYGHGLAYGEVGRLAAPISDRRNSGQVDAVMTPGVTTSTSW